MKKNALKFAIGALLLSGSITVVVRVICDSDQQAPPSPMSVFTVLQAHGGYNQQARSRFTQNATLTYYEDNPITPQSYRERKLKLSVDHSFVRLDKTFDKLFQTILSNGKKLVRITYHSETKSAVKLLTGQEDSHAKFQLATHGLLPILKRITDPESTVGYLGATSKGNHFRVKTPRGSWDLYTNSNHLIDRVEVDGKTLTYGDYRTIDGLNLPFYQQVREGNRLLYEIRLDAVDFHPVFPDGYFKNALL